MPWTVDQLKAINNGNHNIIVSAGAGSGKTTVLKERVLRKLNEGVNVNELLILTFTKASAKEMKDRIRKVIKANNLKEQEALLDSSYITTFDSYSLSLVKKYHYILGLDKSISVVDSSVIEFEAKKILDSIFDELYLVEDKEFLKLIETFCLKDDKNMKDAILSINNKIALKYNKYEYLDNYMSSYFSDSSKEKLKEEYLAFINEKIESAKECYDILLSLSDEKYYDSLTSSTFNRLFEDNLTLEEIYPLVRDFSLPRLPNKCEDELKIAKEDLMSVINKLKKVIISSTDELNRQIEETIPYVRTIINILVKLNKELDSLKKEINSYEFSDIAMFAIDLVKNHEDIRNELKYFYNEIMVDEYQDTSDLQELFISEIANDNVYTVGDIKQAIYGFRNANPELFKRKYDLYAKSINGEKIDLTNNFRSREQVINFINLLFSSIMDNDIGGANYRLDHLMLFGNHSYDSSSTSSFDSDILCYSDILEEYKTEFRREEIEAFLIAKDIDNKVKNRFQVLDKESTRDCRYEDFAILIDKGSDFDLFKQIFDYMHVPLFIDKDKRLTNSYDVSTIANIIRLVVKCKESNNVDIESKYLFTSIARSFLYSVSDNDILIHFKNNDFIDTDIFSKCKYISTYLDSTSPNKIFELIINTFSFYEKIELVGNVEEFMIRIEELSNMCSSLTEIGHDIYYISKYFLDILEEEKDVRYKSSSDDGKSVKIMTIHNSKGLEFKICYFAGLYHQFNIKELTNRFIFDNELGFITPYYKDGINDTFIHMLLQNKEIKNIISEKIRLFYVALTRAKEKIILVTGNNFESIKDFDHIVPSLTRMNYKSFDHILVSTYNKISKFITNVDINKFYISDKYRYTATKDTQSFTINDSSLKVEELNIISNITSKTHYSKGIKRLLSYEEYENIEAGNKIHEILENLDFYNPNYDLVESKFVDIIKSFLNSSLLKNVENAKVYKEYKFIKNDSIGIIDLILEYEDYINIIDYKLSNIDDESYEKQLKEYKIFISSITNKEVNTYLYSLNKKIYKEIK